MEPRKVRTAADAKAIVAERGPHAREGRARSTSTASCAASTCRARSSSPALESGFGFCDVVLGWDSKDQLYDNVRYTGWHTGYPDANGAGAPGVCRALPWEEPVVFFLGEFAGKARDRCARAPLLRRVLERARQHGLRGVRGLRVRVLRVQGNAGLGAREGLSRPEAHRAGLLRLQRHPQQRVERVLPLAARSRREDGFPASRACTRKPGRASSKRRSASTRRSAAADKAALFKTFTKVHRPAPGPDGDVHGEVVARTGRARAATSTSRCKDAAGKPVFHDARKPFTHERHDALVRRRPAEADAGAAGDGVAHGELLHAADPRLLGADRLRVERGQPHVRAARDSGQREVAARRVPRGRRGCQSLHHPRGGAWARACGASRTRSSPSRWSKATPTTEVSRRSSPCRARCGRPRSGSRLRRWRATGSARSSSSISPPRREWEEREFRRHITDWELARYFEII